MGDFLLWHQDGGIVTLTMNRPEERNALGDDGQFQEFEDAVARLNADARVAAVILTGAGSSFCSGGNVKDMLGRSGMFGGDPMEVRRRYRAGIHRIPLALERLDVPLVAAVNGPAMGAGCDLACMCDIRIASERASFGEVFVKLGLIPGDAGCWFLQRAVGYAKAAEMVLTGDAVPAAEALSFGLVSKVVPHEALLDEARAMAGRIAANPPDAVRIAKVLLRQARQASLSNALEMAAACQAVAHHGTAHEAALDRIRQKS